ncbi:dTMP kinase, partial [Gammaproteobacteria bacterium]|nr:dTMP kinase [Gammaproteobacteria bacterium]
QINLSKEWLESKGHSVKLLREPGSTKFGEKIREILLSKDSNISSNTELLLMFAARSEMIQAYFNDDAADFILCDRYYHASIAYQGYGRGLSLELINSLIVGLGCPKPDLTIIYDLDVALGFERKSGDAIDRIESSGIDFFERVREGYKALSKSESEVHLINADSSPEIIHSQSIHLIQSQLNP